jgi:hypothetical protein
MVVPYGQACRDALGEGAEAAAHALAGSRHCRGRRRLGSRASKRVARSAAWMPTHSALQWSMATNTAAWPSPVQVVVRSVPHMMSTASGMMVPSWLRGPRGEPTREGASRSCAPISRSTRRFEVRTPAWRSLAQTFR